MAIDDGGPVFPVMTNETVTCGPWASSPGMAILDWFAGMAPEPGIEELAYVMGVPDDTPKERYDLTTEQRANGVKCVRQLYSALTGPEKFALCAKYKYKHAQAMISERKRIMGESE